MNEPHDPTRTVDCSDVQRPESLPAVPGYRVLREIARGGMGRVLAAYDLSLEREVALKILLPGANADRFVRDRKFCPSLSATAVHFNCASSRGGCGRPITLRIAKPMSTLSSSTSGS